MQPLLNVGPVGFEPTTYGLKVRSSTIELEARPKGRLDSARPSCSPTTLPGGTTATTPVPDYSRTVWHPFRTIRTTEQYGTALLMLLIAYLLSAVSWERLDDVSGLIFILILLVINANEHVPRALRITAFTAAGISVVLSAGRAIRPGDLVSAMDAFSTMVVVGVTILAILARLLKHTRVSLSTVMGAFLAYSLVGFAAAFLFIGVDALSTEDFFNQGPVPEVDYIYFAMITLTTVGFGDLTAATEIGQRLVVVEALISQVFIVVLVARLVSLWQPPRHGPDDAE